jgi:hypothetical protein
MAETPRLHAQFRNLIREQFEEVETEYPISMMSAGAVKMETPSAARHPNWRSLQQPGQLICSMLRRKRTQDSALSDSDNNEDGNEYC